MQHEETGERKSYSVSQIRGGQGGTIFGGTVLAPRARMRKHKGGAQADDRTEAAEQEIAHLETMHEGEAPGRHKAMTPTKDTPQARTKYAARNEKDVEVLERELRMKER